MLLVTAYIVSHFPTPNLGPNIGPFLIELLPKKMNNIPNLHFGEDFMKIGPKLGKLQIVIFTY